MSNSYIRPYAGNPQAQDSCHDSPSSTLASSLLRALNRNIFATAQHLYKDAASLTYQNMSRRKPNGTT